MLNSKLFYLGYIIIGVILLFRLLRWCLIQYIYRKFAIKLVIKGCRLFRLKYLSIGYGQQAAILENICFHFNFGRDTSKKWFSIVVDKLEFNLIKNIKIQQDEAPSNQEKETIEQNSNKAKPSKVVTEKRRQLLSRLIVLLTSKCLDIDIKQLTLKIYREASPSLYAEVVVLDGIKIFASVADRRRTSILNMHLSSKRQVTKLYSMQGLQWSPNFKVDDIAKPMAEMSVHIDVDLIIEPMAGIGSAELRIKLDKIEIVVAEESLSLLTPISTPRSSSQTATNREVNNESDPSSPLQNLYSKLPKSIDLSICQSNATLSTKSSKRCLQVALDVFSARLSKDKWEKNLSLPVFSASLSLNGLQVQENMSNEICVLQRLTTFARTEICDDKLKLAVGGDISTIFFKYSASSIQYWHHLLPRREVKEIENSSQSDRIEIKTARSTALERIVQELLITVNITLADITFEFDFRTDTSKPSHCTRIVMGSLNTVAEVPEANRLKIDFGMENLLVETNKNSEILYGRLRKNNTFVLPQSRKHVWGRVISFANLQAQAFAHMHSGKLHSITINSQATAPCIEFSEAVEDFITMAKIYIPKSKSANNTRIKSDPYNRTNEKIIAEMNIKITDVNLFLCHYNKDINPIMLRIDDALFLNNSSEPLTFNISGIKCATISKKDKENNTFKREMANAIKMGFLDCPSVRVTKDLDNINIVLTEFIVDWDPTTHRCIADNITYAVSTIKQIKEYRQGSTKESTSTKNDVQTNTSTAISKKFVTLDLIAVNMKLSERTTTTWKATALKSIIVNTDNFTISSKTLCWNLDGNDIFSFETVCMTSTHEDQEMQSLRQTLPNLTNPTNKSWCWSVVNANAFFPFAYNFGVAFSDFTGIIKMLRILHKPSKKPGAIEKLPWDLLIKFENANFSCEDDPFEVKLGENYALLLDEADQCTQREELLEARLDKIRKTKGEFIPVKKIEELYRSLHEKNVQIYLQRSKKLHGSPLRRNLFSWKGEDLRIFAFADPSMHGKENIVSCMRRLDPNSPYPDSDPDYSTLWCRLIHIESKILNMPVRDYPQSIINIKGFKVDGMLAGAEVIPPDRATYTSTIHIGQPWNDMEITRRMPPQKYYYNLKIDVEHLEIAYGPCFSPALAQVGLALDLLSKTSRDPSPRLTWWDKMRLLFHGRVSIFASALHYFWHASFDPYDKSERMEIRGKNADLDWFNGHINLMGKLRLLLRTASKYDDCCLLNVPHMEAGIDLIWNCHGDCKDHHSVLPCAPDKIPAHQSDKAYDSYAAFRSRALKIKLALKFMEKAANDTVGKAMSSIPECYLYASSLRWLEHFKLVVLHHITRPVRRGKLYNNVRVRKPGFVQHIDVLDLDVSFPKLMLTYSGSFARKVGFRATSARGHLSIMFQHALIPYQDGLIRRPNSIWTTSESGYDINDVTIMLCANLDSDTEYLSPDFVDFDKEEHLLSLKSLTYRYNNKAIPPSKDDTNPYTHTIKINDLKASWTTFNRDTALSIFWANKKSQTLKHDLSSDFIKQIKHSTAKPVVITENVPEPESQRSFSANESKPFGNMLQDLLSDQSNFVVTCEDEVLNSNSRYSLILRHKLILY